MYSKQHGALLLEGVNESMTPNKRQHDVLPSTPSTTPGTPPRTRATLASRIALLKEGAGNAPKPSISLVWPDGIQPAVAGSLPDEPVWQEILVKFGTSVAPQAYEAHHFECIVKAGMDANAVAFPRMDPRQGFSQICSLIDPLASAARCQDLEPFPFPQEIDSARNPCSSHVEEESVKQLRAGRAKEPGDLRKRFYREVPLDMKLTPRLVLEHGIMDADECTYGQLQVWKLREMKPPSAKRLEQRRTTLALKLKGELNRCIFEELRPTLERQAALLEFQSARARDRAQEAKQFDELAEEGSALVAWPNGRCWPEQSRSWMRFSKWFAMWRSRPSIASSLAFAPLKRSSSECSLQSWAAVSEVSWIDIESKASECGWQEVLDDQMPAFVAAQPAMNLCRADIVELKGLCKPPSTVKLTMEVICILLQVPPKTLKNGGVDFWEPAKSLLSDTSFLERVDGLGEYVPTCALDAAAPYMNLREFTPEEVGKASKACVGLCTWAREVYKYHVLGQASAMAARHQAAGKTAEELLAESQEALNNIHKSDFQELKCLGRPTRGVQEVCSCLLSLFAGIDSKVAITKKGNVKDASWKSCQIFMANPESLFNQLETFKDLIDSGSVPPRNIQKLRRIQVSMGGAFDATVMRKKSAAAGNLCTWLAGILAYYDKAASNSLGASDATAKIAAAAATTVAKQGGQQVLDKADLSELKAMQKPPHAVSLVCVCVCILRPLGTEDESAGWAGAKAMLSNPRLLKALLGYDRKNVTEEQVVKIRDLILDNQDILEGDNLKKISKAALGLFRWVREVLNDYDAAHSIEAKS